MDQLVVSEKSCPECASAMPDSAAFCPGCGRSMTAPARAEGKVGIFSERIAGAIAYLSFIPAVIFLLKEPYCSNAFVRFHSVQCLLLWLACIALGSLLRLLGVVMFWIPVVGPLLLMVVVTISCLGAFLLWMVLVVKAAQGETFKLPLIGDFAEHRAERPPAR